jgi:hypothetical protein
MQHFANEGIFLPVQVNDYPQRRYRIVLRSTMGPIDVYLVRYVPVTSTSLASPTSECGDLT